jgi:hypothetical protein
MIRHYYTFLCVYCDKMFIFLNSWMGDKGIEAFPLPKAISCLQAVKS